MNALLVSDDAEEGAVLTLAAKRAGLATYTSPDIDHVERDWLERPADIVIVACRSPSPSEQMRRIRTVTEAPAIMVTNRLAEDEHCALLNDGIDLVVQRPFSTRLFIAQIRSLLRRAGGMPSFSLPPLTVNNLTLDPTARTIQVGERPPRLLTHLEFRLLYALMINRGQVLPTDMIVERVWGYTDRGSRELVRGLVNRLRGKVEANPRKPSIIVTVPGLGYCFRDAEDG